MTSGSNLSNRFNQEPWLSGIGLTVRLIIREWPGVKFEWSPPRECLEETGMTDWDGNLEMFERLPKWPQKPYQMGIRGLLINPPFQYRDDIRSEPEDEIPVDERGISDLVIPNGHSTVPKYLGFLGKQPEDSPFFCHSPQGGHGYYMTSEAFRIMKRSKDEYDDWVKDPENIPECYRGELSAYLKKWVSDMSDYI